MKKIILLLICCFLMLSQPFLLAQLQAPSANPVLREADSLYFNMNYKAALEKYMGFYEKNNAPGNTVLARIAFCNHFTGHYTEALRYYAMVLPNKPGPALKAVLYSRMAMTYARKKDKANALTCLDSANANGYFNSYEMEHFSDFNFIRNEARFKSLYDSVTNRAYPCKTLARARDFDFWVGEWDVYNNQYPKHQVGTSIIQNTAGECLVLENWQAFNASHSGKSQNWYNPTTGKWTQLWVGSGGGNTQYSDGEYKDGAMRFKYQLPDAAGVMQPGNFIFYNLGPNKVRQYQELSTDGGKTFRVIYDFIYIRKGSKETHS